MSDNDDNNQASQAQVGLRPYQDARAIIRLLQCPQCSYPYRQPVTLPCGNSLCKECVPPLFKRENITYPLMPGRSEGFICSFKDCGLQHTLGDCSLDITLNKVIETVRTSLENHASKGMNVTHRLDEKLHWPSIVDSGMDVMPRSRVLPGGRLICTFTFAEMGELNYNSDLAYTDVGGTAEEEVEAMDVGVAHELKEIIRGEVECQVCYALMLDPLTTSCGHTYCRKCVARMLDHSTLCPTCRRRLALLPGAQIEPSNKSISRMIANLLADQLQARLAMAEQDETAETDAGLPLFPCTLAFPHMPTFLHIFEPRYRLMIRRVMENGTRKFGILTYNVSRQPQGQLGPVSFCQYGTVLQIQRIEMFPDGRCLLETTGTHRFRVLDYTMRDGYMVGQIQRIDDVPLSEEEAVEARETSTEPVAGDDTNQLDTISTQGLLQIGLDFIQVARQRSAHWLHERILAAYGQPPTDAATFPYWFASVLPISEEEKYSLLPTTSVRERLKITARWIQRVEASRW